MLWEDQAEADRSGDVEMLIWCDSQINGNGWNDDSAAHVAHGAVVAWQSAFCGVLIVAWVRVLIVLRCVHHVMPRLLTGFIMLAERHSGRGVALQRQPQHDEDQNEFTQKNRHFFLLARLDS